MRRRRITWYNKKEREVILCSVTELRGTIKERSNFM